MWLGLFLFQLLGVESRIVSGCHGSPIESMPPEARVLEEIPSRRGFLYLHRIRKRTPTMEEKGVHLKYWKAVLKAAFREHLERDPTPAEFEFQEERLLVLVTELVKHTEYDGDGNFLPLPSQSSDHKLVRISGFDVINLRKGALENEEFFRSRFLCVEGYCFVPDLFHLRSEWGTVEKDFLFLRSDRKPEGRRKAGSVKCPTFKDRTRKSVGFTVEYPKKRHEKIRLHYLSGTREMKVIRTRILDQVHFRFSED